jgi:type IV pilus assembly protein PilY1
MDATMGRDTRKFWLYGGTGDYQQINYGPPGDPSNPEPQSVLMDNVLFGFKDEAYPYYREVPWGPEDSKVEMGDLTQCEDTTNSKTEPCLPTYTDAGWVIHLSNWKKTTAEPTIYRGNVYYPIYRPSPTTNRCVIGSAYVCGVDDECGYNISSELIADYGEDEDDQCLFVGKGVLSELVVFGESLFANIAGPADTDKTLVKVGAAPGEIDTYRNSWRQNY